MDAGITSMTSLFLMRAYLERGMCEVQASSFILLFPFWAQN